MKPEESQVVIALAQLVCTIFGGGFALYLFYKSNQEKRQSFVLVLFDRLYNDEEIKQLLRVLDKGTPEAAAEIKSGGALEKQADKAQRLMAYMEELVRSGFISQRDIAPFNYELNLLRGKTGDHQRVMRTYAQHLRTIN